MEWTFDHWEDDDGNVCTPPVRFCGTEREGYITITEDTDAYYHAVYNARQVAVLETNYIDNLSTADGPWSNIDAFSGCSHTFKQPDAVSHYQFVTWRNPNPVPHFETEEYAPGETLTIQWISNWFPDGSTTIVNYYTVWQPSVTVRYHDETGSVVEEIENFEGVTAYDYRLEDRGDIRFDGWYDADGNRVDEGTTYDAPDETTKPVDRYIVDLYARFVTDRTVTKVWDDADDQDGMRPQTVSVQLMAGEEPAGYCVELSAEGEWAHTFENVDAYDAEGVEIDYTAEETEVPDGYEKPSVEVTDDAITITNTHTPEACSISVTKVWEDNDDQDGIRPDSVTVHLLANGEDTGETLVLSAENGFAGAFSNVPVYEAGEKIEYTVTEDAVEGYETSVSGSEADGFTVTNTHKPEPKAEPDTKPDTKPSSKPKPPAVPKTGDPTNTSAAITIALLGAGAVIGGAALRKRKEK